MEHFLDSVDSFVRRKISRSSFLKMLGAGLAVVLSENRWLKAALAEGETSTGRVKRKIKGDCDLVVAEGSDSYQNTVKAVERLGGMARFVKKGAVVVVKPNIGWDRSPEQAANTDPRVVAALVEMCYQAGAKRVNVFDVSCNDQQRVYNNSGIEKAAKEKGAKVYFPDHWNVVKAHFATPSPMEGWPVLRDAVTCDTFINVPVLKHHGLTGLTLSMKNLMGVCSGKRGQMHMDIGKRLTDLTDFINPDLTVIDATRVLLRNGPSGGSLEDVQQMNKIIVGTDPTLADAFACSLMERDPMSVSYIKEAVARGQGSADLLKAQIVKLAV